VIEAKKAFLYSFFTCILITVAYAFLIYYFTGIIVWLSILVTWVGILALSYFMFTYHNIHYGPDSEVTENNYGKAIKVGIYFLWGLAALYVIALCCLY